MITKDDYTNPERILSYNEAKMITPKEYSLLKQPIINTTENTEDSDNLPKDYKYYKDQLLKARKNHLIFDDQTGLKKEILIANTILPDDTKIVDKLTEYNFTYDHLFAIIRFRSIIKTLLINKKQITEELKKDIIIYKNVITKLIEVFEKNFNFNNSTIILNRICEMLVTCPHLFETRTNSKKLEK